MTNAVHDDYSLDTEAAGAELEKAGKSGGGGGDRRKFNPKPTKAGQTYTNKLFVGLIRPNQVPGLEAYPLDHKLFYIKLLGHYIQTGEKKQDFVLCKRAMNKHFKAISKNESAKMFDDDGCPSCEEADGLWDKWKERWAELGYPDQESKKALSKEQYKQVSSDPQVEALKKAALVHTVKDRYVFPVYDMEQQPLQKGWQWYFGPETVFKGLMDLVQAGVKFYSLNSHPSIQGAVEGAEIMLGKDTTKGTRFCEYTVRDNRNPLLFADEELAHLRDQANLPPLLNMVSIWEYDAHKQFVLAGVVGGDDVGAEDAAASGVPATAAPLARPTAPPVTRAPAPLTRPSAPPVTRAAPPVTRPAAAPAPAPTAPPVAAAPAVEAPPAAAQAPVAAATPPPASTAPAATAAAPATTGAAPRPRRAW